MRFRPMYFESFPMQAVMEEHFGVRRDEELDEPEEKNLAVLSAEQAWAGVTSSQVPESDEAEAAAVGADAVFAPKTSDDGEGAGEPVAASEDEEA